MSKRVSAAQAESGFSDLMSEVADGGQRVIIERGGRPVAALVSVDDLELIERTRVSDIQLEGALALVGTWSGLMEDEEVDEMIRLIYAQRSGDTGRLVNLEE